MANKRVCVFETPQKAMAVQRGAVNSSGIILDTHCRPSDSTDGNKQKFVHKSTNYIYAADMMTTN